MLDAVMAVLVVFVLAVLAVVVLLVLALVAIWVLLAPLAILGTAAMWPEWGAALPGWVQTGVLIVLSVNALALGGGGAIWIARELWNERRADR